MAGVRHVPPGRGLPAQHIPGLLQIDDYKAFTRATLTFRAPAFTAFRTTPKAPAGE
ncbi:hypothetical protein [Streptomyces sp. WG7]|uniref:hypothetical protein n=1 Tax=Streptomyces sp. WG7 TaxID=3417650 RepID=UPI003CF0EB8D